MAPVKEELGTSPTEEDWQKWINKWSKLSLEDFLRSDIYLDKSKDNLRPWPEEAVDAYKVQFLFTCTSLYISDFSTYNSGKYHK